MDPLPRHALDRLIDDARPILEKRKHGELLDGRYRVSRELGRGGMGVVYEAHDVELDRRVAIKVLAESVQTSAEVRGRFQREALAAARLNHPNIAAVYEATTDIIAMQLVDGPPLSRLPRGDIRTTVKLVRDAAAGVHYAHQRGVVHRDLKPQNLLVEGDRVFVTDFGLAKSREVDSTLSVSGNVLGTPSYMAPEQARGEVREADPRTDVWGLGATLYDRLAGRPPFTGGDVVQVLRSVVDEEPPAPRSLNPDVPRDLETVVLKCLEKEPERRFASALELVEDLDRWLAGEPVHAQRASARYRLGKWVRKRRSQVVLGVLFVLAVSVAVVVFKAKLDADESARVTEAKNRIARDTLQITRRLDAILAEAQVRYRSGFPEIARQLIAGGVTMCEELVAEADLPFARYLLGHMYVAAGRDDDALAQLDLALAAKSDLQEARLERGLLLTRKIVHALSRVLPPTPPDAVDDMDETTRSMRATAIDDLTRAVDALEGVEALFAAGELAWLEGRMVDAQVAYQQVLDVDQVHEGAALGLARVKVAHGDADGAWGLVLSAVDWRRGLTPAYLARGGAATRPGEAVRGEDDEDTVPGTPSDETVVERARFLEIDGIVVDFDPIVARRADDATAIAQRCVARMRYAVGAGRTADALTAWDAAISDGSEAVTLDASLLGAWNNRGVCRIEKARVLDALGRGREAALGATGALEDFDEALRRAPGYAAARLNRATAQRRLADAHLTFESWESAHWAVTRALEDVETVLVGNAGDVDALFERARLLTVEMRIHLANERATLAARAARAARRDYDVVVASRPRDGRALGVRGEFRHLLGERAAARGDMERALELVIDDRTAARLRRTLEDL